MGLLDFIKELFMADNERIRKLNDDKKNNDIDRDIAGLTSAMYFDHKLNDDKLFKKANVFSAFDHSNKSDHNQDYEHDNDYYYDDYCDYDDYDNGYDDNFNEDYDDGFNEDYDDGFNDW